MNPIVDAALRASLALLIGLALRGALRRHSPALRHTVLAAAIVAAPIVVLLTPWLPGLPVAVPWLIADAAPPSPSVDGATPHDAGRHAEAARAGAWLPAPPPAPAPALPLSTLAFAVWGTGSAAVLGWLLVSAGRMRRLARRGSVVDDPRWRALLDRARREAGLARPIRLIAIPHALLLATWGSRHPRIVIPTCALLWSDARVRTVLAHEVAHIARHDWLLQTVAEGLRALLWWNPLAWLACRALRHDSELACDDAVLRAGVGPTAYADDLLQIARLVAPAARTAAPVAMRMARTSTLERRIVAMLNPTLDRRLPSRRALLGAAVAVVMLLLPVALLRASQAARQPLEGIVYDTTGAVLPGVKVVLDADAAKVETTTDPAGQFRFDGVEPGNHTLQVESPGFRALRQPIVLRKDADWSRAVTLQVGELKETVTVSSRRPATITPLADPGAGPTRVRVGGNIRAPRKTHNVPPVYPPRMVEAGLEGQISVEAVIGVDGRVVRARPLTVQAHPELAQAAVDAVLQWRFDPTLLNGKAVEVTMHVSVNFSLD
jgi:TonB family protein